MMKPIYLDYAATTPAAPEVAAEMARYLTLDGVFANPASRSHGPGWQAESAVEDARRDLAELIGADPREIVWTSGATEADNLAIKGSVEAAVGLDYSRAHIVTSAYEHKAVLDCCKHLETFGARVTYVAPEPDGRVSPAKISAAITPETVLISVMHVNNELGTINDIGTIGAEARAKQISFHVDAAQSVGKLAVDLKRLPVDLLSISGHKFYGPKGIGALYVRRSPYVKIAAQIHGGGHERGMRSGTLPTHQIVGIGCAARLAKQQMAADYAHLERLQAALMEGLADLDGCFLNGSGPRFPGITNLSFAGVDGETLLNSLATLALSSGSACNSATVEPSYVLKALGVPRALAQSALRVSIGRYTTQSDIEGALQAIRSSVMRLRK
ncbi:Cysteine desulfurase [gamma proteobacterium HdN1]|nr:Cysteine desulfurase [gamma proteobacterium HdN1]